ncbi:hypothetical protein EW026_g6211 [Hermanssonia centrifuga]|uniref:NACHT domain-containing protein n=1 Tax=Hermanssonia centrifuga TaxID=98765 RepID=A0A4S4KBP7_9APHY|nr:hypothetical protein EW026_g6211 [Hermanssonia centrifuga]
MTDSRSVTTEATNAVAAAREALEILSPPSAIQGAITVKDDGAEIVREVETAEETLSPIVKTIDVGAFMEKVEMFFKIVDVISEVHPYAKMALSLVKGAYAIVQNQVQRDQKIQDLFAQMTSLYDIVDDLKRQLEDGGIKSSTELLARICKQTIDCCYFIRSYASPGFMQRMAKSTFSTTVDKRISEYGDAFKSLKDEFYGKLHIETRVIVSRVLSDVKRLETKSDLSDISYSRESSLGPSKGCLPGTREEPLERMTTWANSDSHDQPSILVLTGPAGTGKSALAHTMAHQFRELGRLGSSFGFVRTDPTLSNDSTRRIEFLFPTIALGLADFDENIRDALWAAVGKSKEKRTTQDLSLQFDNLIAKPLKSVVLSGPVLIVIDALDECGEAQTREQLLLILKMCAGDLPLNIRLLITSRPEDDILTHLQDSAHIRKWRMDEISSSDQTFQDISLYTRYRLISSRPSKLEGIDEECCRQLAIKSQGLFQWASVACSQITAPNRAGSSPRERYEMLVEGGSGPSVDQESILDALYRKILQQLFPKDSTTEVEMARFKSILAAVLASFEPLALESLNILRKASNDASAPYVDAKIILQYLGSLLSGVTASDSHIPIRPLHTSFRDFLTNKQRGLDFFIDKIAVLQAHERLGLASLARRVAFSPDGAQVGYALGNGTIGVWYIESGSTRTIAESIFGPTSDDDVCLTFSPDGRNLIVGSGGGTVRSWDMSTGDASGAILYQSIMKSRFESITFLADGTLVACGYNEQTIEICQWNAATLQLIGKPLRIEAGSRVYAVGMSSDGRYVAAALVPDIIHLWVLPEGTPVGVPVSVPWRPVWRITFPPDGSHFASAGWRGVDVMEITPTGPVLEVSLQGHTGLVRGLVYSPDGRHIFTCSVDCTIRKWDAHSTDKPDLIIHQYTSSIVGVHISHDGTIASVFEDGTTANGR